MSARNRGPSRRRRIVDSLSGVREVAGNPGLRSLQLASAAWAAAEYAYLVGFLVFAYEVGGPVAVGIAGAARNVPAIVGAPLAATIGDRWPRDSLLRAVLALRVLVVALAAAALAGGFLVVLLALAAVDSLLATLLRPIRGALMPGLARSPEELVAGNVATSTGESLANLVGPALAAVLLAVGGPGTTFVAAAILLAGALAAAFQVRVSRTSALRRDRAQSAARASSGWRTLAGLGAPRLLVAVFTVQRFVRGALTVLLVTAALELFGVDESGVGVLNAAIGFGGLVGAAFAIGLVGQGRLSTAFVVAVVAWGTSIGLTGVLTAPVVAGLLLAASGAAKVALDVAGFSLLQRTIPNEVRSSVLGVLEGLVSAALALGALAGSALVAALGIELALVVGGLLPAAVALASWPFIRHADDAAVVPARELTLLRGVPMFRPLPLTAIEELAGTLGARAVARDEVVVRRGDAGNAFYIVDVGAFETSVDGVVIGRLGPGESFGEIALLRDTPRTATVRALADGRLAVITRPDFLAAVGGHRDSASAAEEIVRARLCHAGGD